MTSKKGGMSTLVDDTFSMEEKLNEQRPVTLVICCVGLYYPVV